MFTRSTWTTPGDRPNFWAQRIENCSYCKLEGVIVMDECQKCNAVADLYDGLCDRCSEQAHWDYQESRVF